MSKPQPLVSVIIPTHKRPRLLSRAVESALSCMSDDELEVIVVPNGGDSTWHESLAIWRGRANVRVIESAIPNPNIARNIGLAAATGTLVRFLDDDDFLIPSEARNQYMELAASDSDVSIYAVRLEDEAGFPLGVFYPPAQPDYGEMVLGKRFLALPFASVYRRQSIMGASWRSKLEIPEDEQWMRDLISKKEIKHISRRSVVGVWFQHGAARLSMPLPGNQYYLNRAASIMETIDSLQQSNRLTLSRKHSAANGLWRSIHGGFFFSPFHWSKVAKVALSLNPESRPSDKIFRILRFINPIIIEWAMLPKRWINHGYRLIKGSLFGFNPNRFIP